MSDSSSSSDNEASIAIYMEAKQATRRGLTTMRELERARNSGERLVIEYNSQGQAIGENANKMQSFIGVCVRQQIPLTCNNWKDVSQELKENVFDCVEMSFVVDPRSKRAILQSAAKKFRTFRYTLKQKYILPFKEEPSLLQTPPKKHSHIDQEQWEAFVNARLSEEWETLSRVQRERREKCIYNHHISRKGYANLARELELSDDPSNRAILWKEARKRKNNEYFDDATRECVNRIDELAATRQGEDILTEALGTPEHRGRVRGVGEYVKPSLYFNIPRGTIQCSQPKKSPREKSNVSKTPKKSTSENSNVSKMKSKGKEVVELDKILEIPSPAKPKTDFHVTQSSFYTDVHVTIKLLNRYAVLSMQVKDTIQINLSKHIFGKEKTIFLDRDDIMHYCGMFEIGYSCILTYIAYLWTVCDNEIISKFMIVDQATISSSVKCKETRCRNLANRLDMVSLDQLVFIPHNTGRRWKLIVIHPRENVVYIVSSFRRKIKESFQGIINTSLRMWQAKHSLPQYRSIIIWKRIKCPRQLRSVECGYYVQKYIREIVYNSSTSISNLFNERNAYKQEEIDEVRLEWANFVGRFI